MLYGALCSAWQSTTDHRAVSRDLSLALVLNLYRGWPVLAGGQLEVTVGRAVTSILFSYYIKLEK